MALTIPIAHDFICPWCWVAMIQANRLRAEFGAAIDWRGYELFPDELEWPDFTPGPPPPANRPATPTRLEFILMADGIELPKSERPHKMRTHNAHEAVEFAKTVGRADELIDALYKAYWMHGVNINDVPTLIELASPITGHLEDLKASIESRSFKHKIVGFDDEAYSFGVYNVPTYFIGNERLAEQPYSVLKAAVEKSSSQIYANLRFPAAPEERPYVYANMVATIDGKIVSGERGESVSDLGSSVDHALLKRTEAASDAVILGATTLRATSSTWNPQPGLRFVVSESGDLPMEAAFFQGEAYVITSASQAREQPEGFKQLIAGDKSVDFALALKEIRKLGVEKLLLLGGSTLNAELLRHDLVDELFLTIAAKVKLGENIPTYAGGAPLARDEIQNFKLLEQHVSGNEVFLRYQRERN